MAYTIKTVGILGGSALARMAAMAAMRLGIRVCIYTPETDSPASFVAPFTFIGGYNNQALLKEFASCVDVITFEDDDIPVETIRYLQKFKPVYPDDRVFETTRNRLRARQFLQEIGIPTARWAAIARANDLPKALEDLGLEQAVLKTVKYHDNNNEAALFHKSQSPKAVWKELKADALLLEEKIDPACEISVIVARDLLGQTAHYGPILNERRNGLLSKSTVPAQIPEQLVKKALDLTHFLSEAIDLVGVLCLEFIVTRDGQLLASDITPHPHNSGHWTIDACLCSQFEQQIRTVCNIQIGSPARHGDAVMLNLWGDEIKKSTLYLEMPNAALHLYGKTDINRDGLMGHVTIIDSHPKISSNMVLATPGNA